MLENKRILEKVIMVGVVHDYQTPEEVDDNLNELKSLLITAGAQVVDQVVQRRKRIDPATYIGQGKVSEIESIRAHHLADTIVFDDDLSPKQVKNLEQALNCKVLDRTAVILDIFASHARTSESKVQVELAQLEYMLPRLTRLWTHLSKQSGGIGTKGPGETQIETDRRLVRTRISSLKIKLEKIQIQKETQRKSREDMDKVTLIGYTNAGKSSLMNVLSDANVLVEDKLFATLDSTTRTVWLSNNKKILLSDTVGFIKKLPANLVASFRSTLDEVRFADVLLHVVDCTHPNFKEHILTVDDTLEQIEVPEPNVLLVFNKIDQLENPEMLSQLMREYPDAVFVSAMRHINIQTLRERLLETVESGHIEMSLEVPATDSKTVAYIHQIGDVIDLHYENDKVYMRFKTRKQHQKSIHDLTRHYQEQQWSDE